MLVSELVDDYLLLGNDPEMDTEEGHYDSDIEWAMDKAKSLMESFGKLSNITVEKDRVSFTVDPESFATGAGTVFTADSNTAIVIAKDGIHSFSSLKDAYEFFYNYVD